MDTSAPATRRQTRPTVAQCANTNGFGFGLTASDTAVVCAQPPRTDGPQPRRLTLGVAAKGVGEPILPLLGQFYEVVDCLHGIRGTEIGKLG